MPVNECHDREMRCFIGAFLEPESAERLAHSLHLPRGLRRVDRASWHVTLKFLGTIPAASVPEVLAAIGTIAGHAIDAQVTCLAGLPRSTYARVVAAELVENADLAAWAGQLAQSFGPEDRPFRPHVTVARSRRPIRFAPVVLPDPIPIRLQAPALYRSHLERAGARYERVGPLLDRLAGEVASANRSSDALRTSEMNSTRSR